VRQNNYGFTFGGPVYIPGAYNGPQQDVLLFQLRAVPEQSGHKQSNHHGSNSGIQKRRLPAGAHWTRTRYGSADRPIIEGTIYDPATTRPAPDGRLVRDGYPNNTIPQDRMDPVALKIQSLIPAANRTGLTNNAILPYRSTRTTYIPSVKIDHSFNTKGKLSYYWSRTRTNTPIGAGGDGLPGAITTANSSNIKSDTQRVNYTAHADADPAAAYGAGYQGTTFISDPPVLDYNAENGSGTEGRNRAALVPEFHRVEQCSGRNERYGLVQSSSPARQEAHRDSQCHVG
jgi:hypothetical protein